MNKEVKIILVVVIVISIIGYFTGCEDPRAIQEKADYNIQHGLDN